MKTKAFTFIEVMAMIAVAGILLLPTMKLFNYGASTTNTNIHILRAQNLAASILDYYSQQSFEDLEIISSPLEIVTLPIGQPAVMTLIPADYDFEAKLEIEGRDVVFNSELGIKDKYKVLTVTVTHQNVKEAPLELKMTRTLHQ